MPALSQLEQTLPNAHGIYSAPVRFKPRHGSDAAAPTLAAERAAFTHGYPSLMALRLNSPPQKR